MRKKNLRWMAITLLLTLTWVPTVSAQTPGCAWGISSLRGDANYPPGWEKFGGTLEVRRPVVHLHTVGNGLYVKGFEFDIRNTTTAGPDRDPNPIHEGLLSVVVSYLPPDDSERVYQLISYDQIFEKGSGLYFRAQDAPDINHSPVRVVAELPISEYPEDPIEKFYIPPGAQDLSMMVFLNGNFEIQPPIGLGLGIYRFDPIRSQHTRLAYQRYNADRQYPAYIESVLANGEEPLSITGAQVVNPYYYNPTWSRDGRYMAIQQETYIGPDVAPLKPVENDLIIVDLYSEDPFPQSIFKTFHITELPWPQYCETYVQLLSPVFSPEGDRLAARFENDAIGFWGAVGIIEIGSENMEPLGGCDFWRDHHVDLRSAPAWHPQEDILALNRGSDWHEHIDENGELIITGDGPNNSVGGVVVLIDADTTEASETQLTNEGFLDIQPAWSPDGEWIAFITNRGFVDRTDIWIMDRNGNHLQEIFSNDKSCASPSFSPDGLNIVFQMGGEIHTVDIWGNNLTRITEGLPEAKAPEWSPALPIPTASISADVISIESGQFATLTWTSTNASQASLNPGIGEVDPAGSRSVSPSETTTYTLSVTGLGGTVTDSIKVIVK